METEVFMVRRKKHVIILLEYRHIDPGLNGRMQRPFKRIVPHSYSYAELDPPSFGSGGRLDSPGYNSCLRENLHTVEIGTESGNHRPIIIRLIHFPFDRNQYRNFYRVTRRLHIYRINPSKIDFLRDEQRITYRIPKNNRIDPNPLLL